MAKNYLEEEEEKRREQEAKKAEQEAKKAEQEAKKAEQTANRQTLTVDEFKKLMKNGQVDQIGFNTDTQQTAQNTQTTTQTDAQKNAQTNTQQATQTETNRQTLTVDEFKKLMKNGQVDQIGFNTDTQQTAQDAKSTQTAEATEEEKKKQGRKDALKQIYEGSYSDVRVKTNMADDRVKKDILNGEAELDKVDLKSLSDYYKTGKNSDFPGSRTLKKDAKDAEKMHTYKDSMPATTDDKIADVEDQINRVYASKKADREEYEDQDIDDDVAQYDSLVNEEDTDKLKEKLKAAQERADIMDSIKEDDDKISALKKQEKLLKRQKEYEGYIQSDDFEEKSKYDKSKDEQSVFDGLKADRGRTYFAINTMNRLKGKSEKRMTDQEKFDLKKAKDALGKGDSIKWSQGGAVDYLASIFSPDSTSANTAVTEMSDDEVKLYNYIYNTKGEKKASQYLNDIAEGLNYKAAEKKVKENKGNTGREIFYGAESGLDQFRQGMRSIVNGIVSGGDSDEALPTSEIQYTGSMYREDLKDKGPKILGSSLGQAGYDMLNTSANMVPSIVVSTATANPALGAATLGASAGGNTFNEAWKSGVTKSQAAAYGITNGLAEAGMQYFLGGISKLGGKEGGSIILNGVNKVTGGKVAAVTSKVDAAISNAMKSDAMKVAYGTGKGIAKSMFEEGREEYLQDALDPIFRNITMGENNDSLSAFVSQDSLYSGLLGAVSGGMFEGTNAHAEAKNAQVYKGIGQSMSEEQKTGLVDYAKKAREDLAEFTDLYDTDTTDINAGKLKIAAEKHIGDGIYNADTIEDAQNQLKTVLEENGDNAFVQQTAVEAYMDFAQSKMIDEAQNSQTQTDVTKDTDTDQAADPFTDNSTDMNVSGDEMVNGPEVQNMESPIFGNVDENKMTPKMVQEIVKQDHTQTDYNDTIKRVEAGYVNNIKRIAQTMDEDTAKVYVDNYNPKIDPKAYQTVFEQARKAAINEVPYENIQDVVKNKDQFQIMRQMVGEDKVQQFYMAGQNELDKITKDTMSNEERFVANTFAQALGKKIRYVDSIRNGFYGANGKYQDGNIYISLKATNKARVVAAHEATHMMKVEAATEYKAYEDYVIQNLKDSSAYEDMIKEYQDRIGSKDLDLLHEEIVADSTETFLSDPDKFVEFAKKDTPAARKLIEVVTKLIDKLKETVKKLTPNGKAAKLLQEDIDTYEEAKDLWYQGIESIMEKNAEEDAKKEDVQNTTDRFSMKDEEKDNIFQKDTLSKSEWAMFYSKIGEKKSRYYFPKAADGNYIMTINNKLVYTNGNWERPRIDRVIEINVDGVSGTERSTAISNIQEEFIEYEKNGREISEDIQRIESKNIEHVYGGRTYIQTYYRNNFATSKRKRAGRSVQLYDENNKISRNKAGRATADRISESERSGDLKEKFSLKEPVEETKEGNEKDSSKAAVNKLDGVRFSTKSFGEQYDAWDKKDGRTKLTIGKTSKVLQSIGMDEKQITIDTGKLIKIKNRHPEMTDKIIKQIPDILQDPMVVLDSLTKPGRPILLGDVLDEKNRPVLVALELNPVDWDKKIIDNEIKVASAYVKDRPQYLLNHSKYYYINDNIKKTSDWLKRTKLQLRFGKSQYGLIDTIISTSTEKSNKNLRYSLKNEEGSSLYASKEDDFAWMEDILKGEPDIKETASILQEGTEALRKAKKAPDGAAVRKISKSILEDIGSQYDLDTFSDNLEKVFSYMQSEDNVSYDDMVRVMTEVALPAVDAIGNVDKTQQARYDRFKRNVLDTPISLSESQREEVANAEGSVKNWIDQNREHIKIRNDGADLDSGAWHELVVASGYELTADVNESEMPLVLSEYMDGLRPTVEYYDVDGATRENMAYDTALNIFKKYYGEYAANQKVKNALEHKVAAYKKKVRKEISESYRKEYNATLREKKDTIDFLTGKLSDLNYELRQARRDKDEVKEQDLQEEVEKLKQKLADTKAMNMERIARIKAKNRSSRLQQSYRKRETEYRNKIKKVWNDLQKKATRPTETSYVPSELVKSVLDVCTAVDVAGNNSVMAQKMARLRDVYETLEPKTDHAKATDELYDANLYEQIKELQSNFQNKRLSDLSYNDLKKVYETMNAIKKQVIQSTQLIGKKKNADAYKKASKEIEIIKNVQRDTVTEKAIDKALHGLTSFGASPLKFKSEMKRVSGYTEGSVLVELADDFNQGTVDAKKIEMETENIFNSVLEKEDEVKKTIGKKEEDWVDFMGKVDKKGNPIRIPRSMLLSLAMHIENRSNLKHIIWGGVRIPDAKRYIKGKKDALERGQVIRFGTSGQFDITKMSRQQIEDICEREIRTYINDNLTSYEKEFLKKSRQFFWDYSGKKINEISNQLKGYDIAKVKNYFPIVTDKNFTKTDVSGLIQNGTLEGMGILKERVSASNPIILESIFDTIERHENNVAKYVGYAIPVRNFNKIYNTTLVGYHDSISNELGKKFGTEAKTYIERFLTDIQSKRDGGPSTLYDKLRGNYAQGILTGNLSVMIKQAASFPTAAYVLGWDNLLKALPQFATNKAFKTDYELIGKYSGLLWDRTQGAFNSELMDIKKNAPKLKIPYLTDWFLNGIEKIDQRTVGSLWYAAESKVQKENSHLKKGTDLYYQKVAEAFNEAVLQTQPMYETTQLSDASRNPNKFWKMVFMFKTQPMQNFNILYDSTAEYMAKQKQYKKGNITKKELQKSARNFRAAMSSQVVAAVTFSLMSLAAGSVLNRLNPYKDDDGKLTPDSVIRQLVSDVFSSVAGSFVYGSEVYNFFKSAITGDTYYGTEISSTETLSNMASGALSLEKAIQGISNANTKEERTKYIRKVIRQTESLIGDTSEMLGVPYENAKKLIEAFTSRVADFKFEDLYTTDSTSEIKQEAYEDGNATYKELYKLYDNGERTKKQITSAIKSTLKEKDTRIEEAARLRLAGNTEKYMEVAKEIIKDGFKQDDVVTAINGKMNELKKDKKESTTSKKKSLYSTDDVVRALQNGKDAQSVIDEIVKVGKENGTDKKSSIRSAVKKAYQEEYRKADDAGKKKIEEKVSGLKADGEALFDSKSFYEWNMQYSGKDVTADIQAGKLKDAQAKIDDIYNKKYQYTVSNAKTFAEKKKAITSISSSIKSSITSVYKPMYQKGDAKTRMQIIQTLNTLRVGQYQLYNQTDYLRWNKAQ